jgi:hypothetical protein
MDIRSTDAAGPVPTSQLITARAMPAVIMNHRRYATSGYNANTESFTEGFELGTLFQLINTMQSSCHIPDVLESAF